MIPLNTIQCRDCLEGMKEIPDKNIDLIITDPPYGLGDKLVTAGNRKTNPTSILYDNSEWFDVIPTKEYFDEMFRISKNQIICGGNYFCLPPTRGFIIWDKIKYAPSFSQCEFIWTSFDIPAKIFSFCSNGGFVVSKIDYKIHPTQKPVKLYEWIIKNYAKVGDIICDPFFGSGACIVACIRTCHQFVGFENEKSFFSSAETRIKNAQMQGKIGTWFP